MQNFKKQLKNADNSKLKLTPLEDIRMRHKESLYDPQQLYKM
jgi:hypothetical protein